MENDAQEILFGWDATEKIVAVETAAGAATIFRRDGDRVIRERRPFSPWLLTADRWDLEGAQWDRLDGAGLGWRARFANWAAYQAARMYLREKHLPSLAFGSSEKQYLVASGQTLFKGLSFEDVHRVQLDIETLGLFPQPEENEIFLLAILDNRGNEVLVSGDEAHILRETVKIIRDLDPDVIEGHNIYGFDLPYLAKRAELRQTPLALGRDGSTIRFGAEGARTIGGARRFTQAHIYGRHIVDTLHGVQRYDIGRGELVSHGLKECARVFGVACEERVLIPHTEIAKVWREDPERVKQYCVQDVRETRAIAEIVCPADFYTTQMVPDTYQNGLTAGTGEKIDAIMIREYLRQGKAIPIPELPTDSIAGGYTDIRRTGVIHNVVKCDAESLYPTIMLSSLIKPQSDTLGVFLPALSTLTERRFDAKKRARASTGHEKAYWDGLQSSFKILINSFYGYLGAVLHFNDYDAAAQVTSTGREIVQKIVEELERTGSRVIEIDTDGVYFTPPDGVDSQETETAYIDSIGRSLPEGIRLAHDGRYRMMISLKIKNYILVCHDGRKIFKGASVRSRADERFGRAFIASAVDLLIDNRPGDVADLYRETCRRINAGEMDVHEFCRRERVTEKTFTSTAKRRAAVAAKDARVGEHIRVYQKQDGSLGLAEEYAGDEDQNYLLDKLYKFACRLREAFGQDFDRLFPKPSERTRAEAAGQQTLCF